MSLLKPIYNIVFSFKCQEYAQLADLFKCQEYAQLADFCKFFSWIFLIKLKIQTEKIFIKHIN